MDLMDLLYPHIFLRSTVDFVLPLVFEFRVDEPDVLRFVFVFLSILGHLYFS
jgi:hypothetical protein